MQYNLHKASTLLFTGTRDEIHDYRYNYSYVDIRGRFWYSLADADYDNFKVRNNTIYTLIDGEYIHIRGDKEYTLIDEQIVVETYVDNQLIKVEVLESLEELSTPYHKFDTLSRG